MDNPTTSRLKALHSHVCPIDTPQLSHDICQFNGKRIKGIGGKRKKGLNNNNICDSDSLFMHHYRQWYTSYYGQDLKVPKFNKQELNLEDLWKAVMHRGGSKETSNDKLWAEIGRQFNPPKSMTNLSFHIKRIFEKYLLAYEKSVSPSTAMEWRHAPVQTHSSANLEPVPPAVAPMPSLSSAEIEYGSSYNSDKPVYKKMLVDQEQEDAQQEFIAKVCGGDEPSAGNIIRLWIPVKQNYEIVKIIEYCPKLQQHVIRFSNGLVNSIKLKEHTWSVCSEDTDNAANQPQQTIQMGSGQREEEHRVLGGSLPPGTCELISLVYNSQAEVVSAQRRIRELEVREKELQEELVNMKLEYHTREQQLRIMVVELTQKVKEANEARQVAEGAITELRHCLEYIIHGNANPPPTLFTSKNNSP